MLEREENKIKIFLIEDDCILKKELSKLLGSYGYECSYSDDFENIIEITLESNSDLVLLDINLPYFDGFHICREIRNKSDVPIIIVTSRNTDMDELMGMNLGADDFITKPYNKQILLARIGATLKRMKPKSIGETIKFKGMELSIGKSIVSLDNKIAELTKNELHILSILIQNAGKIVSRKELMNELWQSDEFIDDNTLTVNVNRLRHKLDSIDAVDLITTKRGQGYLL